MVFKTIVRTACITMPPAKMKYDGTRKTGEGRATNNEEEKYLNSDLLEASVGERRPPSLHEITWKLVLLECTKFRALEKTTLNNETKWSIK